MIEGIAFGRNPGRFVGAGQKQLIILERSRLMLPVEGGQDGGQGGQRDSESDSFTGRVAPQHLPGGMIQRIARHAEDAGGGGGEVRVEAVDMKFGQEELRDGVGIVGVAIGAARHLQPVERIDGGHLIAQRQEDASEGLLAPGQGAGRPIGKADAAQRAMVEQNPSAAGQRIGDIGRAAGHAGEQVVEQADIHRHGEGGAGDMLAACRQQRWVDRQHVERATSLRVAQRAGHQPLDRAHILIRHINAPG